MILVHHAPQSWLWLCKACYYIVFSNKHKAYSAWSTVYDYTCNILLKKINTKSKQKGCGERNLTAVSAARCAAEYYANLNLELERTVFWNAKPSSWTRVSFRKGKSKKAVAITTWQLFIRSLSNTQLNEGKYLIWLKDNESENNWFNCSCEPGKIKLRYVTCLLIYQAFLSGKWQMRHAGK